MTTARHLSTSRERFVFEAHQTAQLVDQNLYALLRASNGRIDAKTAPEIRALADRITQLHVAPRRTAGGVKPIVMEALKIIRAIRAALATLDDPTLNQQLKQTTLTARRSTAQMKADLDTHATFLETYGARVRPMLPPDIDARIATLQRGFEGRRDLRDEVAVERCARQSELQAAQARLSELLFLSRKFLALTRRLG